MAFTYDPTTDRGKVRLIVPDRVDTGHVFTDAEIDTFLTMEVDVRRSAALALETIASDEAMVLKVIKLGDLSTNGAQLSEALLKRAAALRTQAEDAEAAEDGGAFDVIEMVPNQFAYRERVYNEALRDS